MKIVLENENCLKLFSPYLKALLPLIKKINAMS